MNENIARMIVLLARKSQLYIGNALKKYDLTAAEQPFFMALQHYEGVTQEELTALVCVDKSATARAVKSLEKKGYLIRVQDEQDRRQNRIYPTAITRRLGPAVREELLHFNDLLIRNIHSQDLDRVLAALSQMEENFADMMEAGGREIKDLEAGNTEIKDMEVRENNTLGGIDRDKDR